MFIYVSDQRLKCFDLSNYPLFWIWKLFDSVLYIHPVLTMFEFLDVYVFSLLTLNCANPCQTTSFFFGYKIQQ